MEVGIYSQRIIFPPNKTVIFFPYDYNLTAHTMEAMFLIALSFIHQGLLA